MRPRPPCRPFATRSASRSRARSGSGSATWSSSRRAASRRPPAASSRARRRALATPIGYAAMEADRERATCALLAVTAAYVTFGVFWRRAALGLGEAAYDFYNLFYPNAVYAVQSVTAGGRGLLWTPYQACGVPFLANTEVGLFYPGHLVFALFPREAALLASVLLHLTIAGAGTFLLCRELGLARPAALAGALAFQLGPYVVQLAGWGPIHLATYAWMPVAMWRTERLVRSPSRRNVVALAAVLALQLVVGFVQISYFTYEVVALRIAWAL